MSDALALAVPIIGAAVLWFVIDRLKANAIIAGLGLSGLGLAGTDFTLQTIFGSEGTLTSPKGLLRLGAGFGPLTELSLLSAAMPVAVILIFILLCRTRYGLGISASGEHPFAAASVGIDPSRRRLVALLLGGILCGLGGMELALGSLHVFSVGMTAGRGYMAFAAAILGVAHPVASAFAALSFAFLEVLGIKAQLILGNSVPSDLLLALPYVFTVVGVWLSGWLRGGVATVTSSTELRESP